MNEEEIEERLETIENTLVYILEYLKIIASQCIDEQIDQVTDEMIDRIKIK